MTSHAPLEAQRVAQALRDLPRWSLVEGKLERELRFPSFARAFAFLTEVAFAAEALDHHPEWSNVYNRVRIRLWTHDIGALSELDLELARRIDAAAGDA